MSFSWQLLIMGCKWITPSLWLGRPGNGFSYRLGCKRKAKLTDSQCLPKRAFVKVVIIQSSEWIAVAVELRWNYADCWLLATDFPQNREILQVAQSGMVLAL
jgi:hypothetical protein